MKHRIRITGWCITWMMLLCACENYSNSAYEFEDLYVMTNDSYGKMANPSTVLANNIGLEYALMAYDESVDRYVYTNSNPHYSGYYSNINSMNILLARLDDLSGDIAESLFGSRSEDIAGLLALYAG